MQLSRCMVLVSVISIVAPAHADSCDAILGHGIWETRSNSSDFQNFSSFQKWFCAQSFSSNDAFQSSAKSISVDLTDGVSHVFGDYMKETKDGSWSKWYSATCSGQSGTNIGLHKVRSHITTASKSIVDAWSTCRRTDGISVKSEYSSLTGGYTLTFAYNDTRNIPVTVGAAGISFINGDESMCKPALSLVLATIQNQSEFSVHCAASYRHSLLIVTPDDSRVRVRPREIPIPRVPCRVRDDVFVVGDMEVSSSQSLKHKTVCLVDGAKVRVRNGSTFTIDAETLIVEGVAEFDGSGEPGATGAPGVTPPEFIHAPGGTGTGYDHARCEREFGGFGNHPDDFGGPGKDGGAGGAGAKIDIRFRTLVGNTAGVTSNVKGGPGGEGGQGGLGRKMRCARDAVGSTRIPQESRRGPNGKPGSAGPASSFTVQQTSR